MSADPRKKLEEEIHSLERELREELPKALKTAAALGDLSENADYSAARERQDFVRARLGQLKKRVADLSLQHKINEQTRTIREALVSAAMWESLPRKSK